MWIHDLHILSRFIFVFPTMISATLSKTFFKTVNGCFSGESEMRHGKKKGQLQGKLLSQCSRRQRWHTTMSDAVITQFFLCNFRGSPGTPYTNIQCVHKSLTAYCMRFFFFFFFCVIRSPGHLTQLPSQQKRQRRRVSSFGIGFKGMYVSFLSSESRSHEHST